MNIISYLFEPLVFFGVLIGLFVISMLIIFSFVSQEKGLNKEIEENVKKDKIRISELEAILTKTKEEQRQKTTQLEDALKNKETELNKRLKGQEIELEEKKQLKAVVSKLEEQLKEKEGILKKEIYAKEELDRRVKELEEELAKLRRELSLSNQMYDGLKGQYDELEKNTQNLAQQLEEEQSPPKKEVSLQQLSKLEELTRPEQPLAPEEKTNQPSEDNNSKSNSERS